MNKSTIILITVLFSAIFITSCKDDKVKLENKHYHEFKKPLRNVNNILVDKDSLRITSYCKRRKWDIKITDTGLFYEIYHQENGDSVYPGNHVLINYTVSLLDGTVCYSTDTTGPETFKLGHGVAEMGLEQGLLMMQAGDKAHLILPPHLAHGLIGDEYKIPPRSIIIYDVELLKVFK